MNQTQVKEKLSVDPPDSGLNLNLLSSSAGWEAKMSPGKETDHQQETAEQVQVQVGEQLGKQVVKNTV